MRPRPRILIADDDRSLLGRMSAILGKDFATVTASNGSDAVEKARRTRPDIIVVDAEMPRMDGYRVCRALRDRAETARVPIIVVTDKTSPSDARDAFAAGASDYLAKPFSISQLRARADTWFMRGPQ